MKDQDVGFRGDEPLELSHELTFSATSWFGWIPDDSSQTGYAQHVQVDDITVEDMRARLAERVPPVMASPEGVVVAGDAHYPAEVSGEGPPHVADVTGNAAHVAGRRAEQVTGEENPSAIAGRDDARVGERGQSGRQHDAQQAQSTRALVKRRDTLKIRADDQRVDLRRQAVNGAAQNGKVARHRSSTAARGKIRNRRERRGVDRERADTASVP
jgi:hypothetical protein